MLTPEVSIITANYNSEKYITQTINSIIKQTFTNWEMIIVDDFSTDASCEIIEKINENRIKLIKLDKNGGPAVSRNVGIKESQGRYIVFIDSDDLWETEFLKKSIQMIKKKNCGLIYSSYYRKNEDLTKDFGAFIVPERVKYTDILKSNSIACLTGMYDTKKLGKCYMPEIQKRQDMGLWLSILKKIDYAYGIKEPLATYRMRKLSVSSNKFVAARYNWKLYRQIEHLSFIKSLYYFSHYMIRGFLKNKNIKKT